MGAQIANGMDGFDAWMECFLEDVASLESSSGAHDWGTAHNDISDLLEPIARFDTARQQSEWRELYACILKIVARVSPAALLNDRRIHERFCNALQFLIDNAELVK
jgi:hypothetical protein